MNQSTKLLLELLRPKLVQLAQEIINATGASGGDRDNIFADVQSQFIDLLMHKYVLGEYGYMLHYLFGVPKGLMRRYVSSEITKKRKYNSQFLDPGSGNRFEDGRGSRVDQNSFSDNDRFIFARREPMEPATNPDDTLEEAHVKALAGRINDIIDDGITLRLAEYRVLRFCLDNASDARRPLNGLHIYMGRVLGVVRSRCTKLYSDALAKIREASDFEESDGDFEWTGRG